MEPYQTTCDSKGIYPIGLTKTEGGIHVSVAAEAKECSLLLFLPKKQTAKERKEAVKIPFPREGRTGQVWEMDVSGADLDRYEYAFEADGKRFSDPYGRCFRGHEQWGRLDQARTLLTTPVREEDFDWEGDQPLHIPYSESIVYRAHVRGLTRHASSGVENRGTFRGVMEKIPYLKELGITTLELLPVSEFREVMFPDQAEGNPYGQTEPTGKLNYWGYEAACLCAPKASYAGKGLNPVTEFKSLVRALHQAGIELITEHYFTGKESPQAVVQAMRTWVCDYHVDGLHLVGQAPTELLAQDPYLADTKLWALSWGDPGNAAGKRKRLAEYHDGYLIDMRKALKGDEEQMNALIFRSRNNPAHCGTINYMATTNGFTLMDMVSYDQKHNEANGEGNRDGTDYNYSWNCGCEGPARKKKIVSLRKKQLKNALLMLFLSQGTPMLLAGDEFGNSQNGNNNAYCQDNEISWLNWKLVKRNGDLLEFVRCLIRFRRMHPVFHMEKEPRLMDYLACGQPDVSYHGMHAWRPEFENFRRQIGILYCGAYGMRADGSVDDTFFVVYNMHWEPHEFDLPNLPGGGGWRIAFDTGDEKNGGYYPPGNERIPENPRKYVLLPRSITVFIGKTGEIRKKP